MQENMYTVHDTVHENDQELGKVRADNWFRLFEFMLYDPVNRHGHVGTLPPSYWIFTQI